MDVLEDRYDSHYGRSMQPLVLRIWAQQAAVEFDELFGEDEDGEPGKYAGFAPVLVYTGMSGIASATALALYSKLKPAMMYVRKEHEDSHGISVETSGLFNMRKPPKLIFVDDFIDTGNSLIYALKCVQRTVGTRIDFREVLLALSSFDGVKIYQSDDYCAYPSWKRNKVSGGVETFVDSVNEALASQNIGSSNT